MANPTTGWDKIPVFGTWRNIDDSPRTGRIRFTVSQRVIATDGTAIYPAGGTISQQLGAETGSVSVEFPATDDPDIAPTGWKVKVEEQLDGSGGKTYYIEPKLGDLPDGFNLNRVVVPDDAPAAPPPVYMRGQAGGLAALDADGDVTNAAGAKVTGGAASSLSSLSDVSTTGLTAGQTLIWNATTGKWEPGVASGGATALSALTDVDTTGAASGQSLVWDGTQWVPQTVSGGGSGAVASVNGKTGAVSLTADDVGALPDSYTPSATDVSGLAAVATTGAYADLTGAPVTVPPSRTINGKPLSADVTLVAGDVGAATNAQGTKADSAVQPASLATVATTGSYSDLTDRPTIPTSPTDIGAASALQGAKADTAVQPGSLAPVATSGTYSDLTGRPTIPATPGDLGAATAAQGAKADTAVQPADLPPVPAMDGGGHITMDAMPPALFGAINRETAGSYPARPTFSGPVIWVGADQPVIGDMADGDLWVQAAS